MAILLHQRFQLKKSCPNLCTAAVKYELLILFLINAPISPYSPPLSFLFDPISAYFCVFIQYFTGDSTLNWKGRTGAPTI